MNLRAALIREHSKAESNKIVAYVGSNQKRFDELFKIFLTDEYQIVQRAGWPLSSCVEKFPDLISPHFTALVKKLSATGNHEAVKRNILRILQHVKIPKKIHGSIMDKCFNYIAEPKEKPAVKAFSLTILANLAQTYPDILAELKIVIEEKFDQETPAFRARAKKILKKYYSIKPEAL